ncbi:uncharacterized protein LOC132707363 [Cylas formicarius]|uniref:uncharacterized protein LOC132707363 n=1 Tax=Cylas formicarius TaxID=197179 RepID=UPI00295893AE|nr:uncharacterized protein LOC132707363 [Cylas formicarius]XP_060535176.1 uncharacterized protein LOC132707363 [Cylas formicarius]
MPCEVEAIEQFEDLISDHIGPDEQMVDYKLTNLTAPGENYGSIMLKIDVVLKNNKTGQERLLDLVGKMIPRLEVMQNIFNVQVTFKNEIAFYLELIPAVQLFLEENNILDKVSYAAQSYGGRISLDPSSEKVDENAIILLQNLKVLGYTTCDRRKGFDLKSTRIILKNLAKFNAYPLALKLKKPKEFETKVKPNLVDYYLTDNFYEFTVRQFAKMIKTEQDIDENTKERAVEIIRRKALKVTHEPWATVTHNDLWVNNLMVKFTNDEPVDAILVDFQVCEYKSPLRDLLFFLFSSVTLEVLREHLDELIDLYYEEFANVLKLFKLNTDEFSRKNFDQQVKLAANESEFYHVIYMLPPILFDGKLADMSEIGDKVFNAELEPTDLHKKRFSFTVKEFARRGWI